MSEYKYFKLSDFDCQETGENRMEPEFIEKLDELREACGFPFIITSGYRSPEHSIELRKKVPGTHAQGIAADIKVNGAAQRFIIVEKAHALGFGGIGVAHGFIHVDIREKTPVLWCY
jgi:zinc D-Ala-D-Ala carboxypeptidase